MPELRDIRIHAIGPFADEVYVDLTELDGPLVALIGENGEGKTFFCESWAAAMHRKFLTRGITGHLKEVAVARDGYIETTIVNGHYYKIRQTIDAKTGDGSSLVTDADGKTLTPSGGITEYKAWAKKHLPAPEVLACSIFGVQGKLGFLDLDPGPRKGVLLRVLGHEHLEKKATAAGKRADASEVDLKAELARAADERKRCADADALTQKAKDLAEALPTAEMELAVARAAKESAQADMTRAELAAKAADEARARRLGLTEKIAKADKIIADTEARLARNREVLAEAGAIRAAAERLPVATAEETDARAALAAIDEKARALATERKTTEDALRRERQAAADWTKAIAEQERRLTSRAHVEDAAARLPARKAALEAMVAEHAETTRALEELRTTTLHVSGRRITTLREAHETIVQDDEVTPRDVSKAALAEDDTCTKAGDEAPNRIAQLTAITATQKRDIDRLRVEVQSLELVAAKKDELAAAEASLVTLRQKEATSKAEVSRLEIAVRELAAAPDRAPAKALLDRLAKEIEGLRELSAKLVPLSNAETRIAELEPVLAQSRTAAAEARAELGAIADVPPAPRPDIVGIEKRLAAAEKADRKVRADMAATAAALEAAEASRVRLAEIEKEVRRLEEEVSDWRLLQQDLGRDGIQALEIDGVGPELTEIANELLRSCYGTRFMVEISTTRPKAAGEGDKEGCWVLVTDLMKQRTSEAKTFCGGEKVLIAEAVNLAILAIVCKKTGDREPTIVRDETAAALSQGNGPKYIAMLRRAAGMLGASKVLYVTHDPQLQALADSRLLFSNGTVVRAT